MEGGLDYVPTAKAFNAMQSSAIKSIVNLSAEEVRPLLPSLVRASLCAPLDISKQFSTFQHEIQKKISDFLAVNSIVSLLSIDFKMVHDDALKEQQLRKKLGSSHMNEDLLPGQKGLILEFEESDSLKRTRLVLSEILRIMTNCQEQVGKFTPDFTELFECAVYLEEISDVLCIAFAELPFLLPAPDLSEALLRVKYGPIILSRIIANNPDCFDIVCSSILSHTNSSDDFEVETQMRVKTLRLLCSMNPTYKKILRAECVSLCKLAGLAVELSLTTNTCDENSSDLVSFFTGILLASDAKTKGWIAEYIKSAQKEHKDTVLALLKAQLIREMHDVVNSFKTGSNDDQDMETEGVCNYLSNKAMHGIAIIKLYCALKSMTSIKLSHDESEALINLITSQPSPSAVGVRYIVVSLCALVACAFLLHTQEREEKVTSWLKELITKSAAFDQEAGQNKSYGEILLLIAIHFHGHSLEPIVDLVCSTLGIKLKLGSLTKIKILFTQQVFPEKVLAEHALTVVVTKGLNNHIKGFLPIHCVLQLMRSRVFTKNSIPVKDWLFKQICSCTIPVHSLILPLIETYVQSIITPLNVSKTKQQRMSALEPFNEDMILELYTDGNTKCHDLKTTQLLMMVYALVYQNALLTNMKSLINNPKSPREYSTILYSTIPMKQLLICARADEASYSDLYPPLLRHLTTHYPHLCLVEDWIQEEQVYLNNHVGKSDVKGKSEINVTGNEILVDDDPPQKKSQKLTRLLLKPATQLIPCMESVLVILPRLFEFDFPRKLQTLIVKMWMKLNTVIPRRLWLRTVNVLRQQPANIKFEFEKTSEYSDEEIQKDPLIVLRCDSRVYRCPPLFEIISRVLNGYLTASRALLTHHLLANPIAAGSKPVQEIMSTEHERDELKSALISSQESAAIQILLEVCLPTDIEKKAASYKDRSTLREIQCQVCCFIHQCFIAQPKMSKLIHFQGYPPELLSVTVAGVPSMHICIDFIPELLNQPHLEKQLFAVQLISHLAVQYPIPKSYSMSSYVIQRMKDLLAALPVVKRNQFFVPACECMCRISQAFPPLREEITGLLISLGRTSHSQWNKSSIGGVPRIRSKLDESSNDDPLDDEMEVDSYEDISHQAKDIKTSNKLDGDNPAYSRNTFLKVCTSEELYMQTCKVYTSITELSLRDKLVTVDYEDGP